MGCLHLAVPCYSTTASSGISTTSVARARLDAFDFLPLALRISLLLFVVLVRRVVDDPLDRALADRRAGSRGRAAIARGRSRCPIDSGVDRCVNASSAVDLQFGRLQIPCSWAVEKRVSCPTTHRPP